MVKIEWNADSQSGGIAVDGESGVAPGAVFLMIQNGGNISIPGHLVETVIEALKAELAITRRRDLQLEMEKAKEMFR